MTNEEKLARLNLFLSGVVDQLEEIKKDFCKEPREWYIVNDPKGAYLIDRTELGRFASRTDHEIIHVKEVVDERYVV